MITWDHVLRTTPLIAILRGIEPHEAVEIAGALYDAGFLCVEVPLNSPEPFASLSAIKKAFDSKLLVGAGTVLTPEEVLRAKRAGAEMIISPNVSEVVIATAKTNGLTSIPGIMTPTEAMNAIRAGADALKLFPAEIIGSAGLRAMAAVLPKPALLLPVGGITPEFMGAYVEAGAAGFGIGSALYSRGLRADVVRKRAEVFVRASSRIFG